MLPVRKDATRDAPKTVEVELGKSAWGPTGSPLIEDTKFINLQIADERWRDQRLRVQLIWDSPRQLNDLDLFLYDSRGQEIGASTRPTGQEVSKEIISVSAERCEGFTVEVRGYRTLDTRATLRIWLSEMR